MKIEISHDLLARKVYERASTDDKMRLKVASFVRQRYADFEERKAQRTTMLGKIWRVLIGEGLLGYSDLSYVEQYQKDLDINIQEQKFVKYSRQWKRIFASVLVVLGLSLFSTMSTLLYKAETRKAELAESERKLQDSTARLQAALTQIDSLSKLAQAKGQSLDVFIAKLDSTNNALSQSKDSLNIAMRRLEEAQRTLEAKNRELVNSDKEKSNLIEEKNRRLSKQEQLILEYQKKLGQKPTAITDEAGAAFLGREARAKFNAGKIEEAFLLATAAWEKDKLNDDAINVLRDIKSQDQQFEPNLPPNKIIERYKKRLNVTPMSPDQIDKKIKELSVKKYN